MIDILGPDCEYFAPFSARFRAIVLRTSELSLVLPDGRFGGKKTFEDESSPTVVSYKRIGSSSGGILTLLKASFSYISISESLIGEFFNMGVYGLRNREIGSVSYKCDSLICVSLISGSDCICKCTRARRPSTRMTSRNSWSCSQSTMVRH